MNCFLRFHFDPPPGLIALAESPEQRSLEFMTPNGLKRQRPF